MQYTVFETADGICAGGCMPPPPGVNVPSNWTTCFAVDDADAVAARAAATGGVVMVPPSDIPGIGRFSVLIDPQGAVFAVIAPDLSHMGS